MLNNGAYSRYNIIYNYQLFHWHYVLYDIEFFTQENKNNDEHNSTEYDNSASKPINIDFF